LLGISRNIIRAKLMQCGELPGHDRPRNLHPNFAALAPVPRPHAAGIRSRPVRRTGR
jgi:hypothetical protein